MIDWLRDARARAGATRQRAAPPPEERFTLLLDGGALDGGALDGGALAIRVRRRRDARRLTMRMAPDGSEARITMPIWGTLAEARRFADEKRDWLARQKSQAGTTTPLAPGSSLPFVGETIRLEWRADYPRKPVLVEVLVPVLLVEVLGAGSLAAGAIEAGPNPVGKALQIGGPAHALERRVRDWLRAEAKQRIADDLAHYAAVAGHALPALALTSAMRRWGSCTANGTIRINWRLVMAPAFVRRSVVAHEVAHLAHFDHSPAFHAELARLFEGDIRAANRWLKQHGRSLYGIAG